ncbi:MAG TPA: bifunctional protein-serine/threonine kinase/phosphatase [Rhodocyclaceae bacterium]
MSTLKVAAGYSSQTGPRPRNEDFCGLVTPEGEELETKGVLAAVADGVGGGAAGREAAEYTVRGLLSDYYATPDTWGVAKSIDVVVASLNDWIIGQGAARREMAGMATTLCALVLRGNRWHLAHVGDSRLYRLRDGELICLTRDHVWDHPEMRHVLKRAVGLDRHLALDQDEGELLAGDVFMLCSDGVWSTLGDKAIAETLRRQADPDTAAANLAMDAVRGGAQDNCTALVLRVDAVPEASLRDRLSEGARLPLPPPLKPGQEIDGLLVQEVVHESRVTLLYRVLDPARGSRLTLKTLRPEAADEEARNALLYEEWLARRVGDGAFPQVYSHPARAHLYYLLSWHEGATLKAMLARGHRFNMADASRIGIDLLRAVATLHRLGVVHRDIKPDNVLLEQGGTLRILDLGVAASDGVDFQEINNPGTPSYMAPELFAGVPASHSSDLYAVGVTLYELLTRKYPYGEIEPFQHPRFGDPVSPTRWRPDIPQWLEAVLLKAVARDRKDRFETAEEFLVALEYGAHRPLRMPRRMPLAQRVPYFGLRLLAVGSLTLNIFLLWLLLVR